MNDDMQRLILFAKRPRLGAVKTRLVPPLSAEGALALYRAFLADQLALVARFADRCTTELCMDEPDAFVAETGPPAPHLVLTRQGPGDLGERMLRAFRRSADEGAEFSVALGADSPTLRHELVLHALSRLEAGAQAVVGPAADGGYVLLGLRGAPESLFRDVPWGSPAVLATTRERAREAGLTLVELAGWYDVDDGAALERLRRELADPAVARRAPATARALARLDSDRTTVV